VIVVVPGDTVEMEPDPALDEVLVPIWFHVVVHGVVDDADTTSIPAAL
jgi:hypothetical protein